MEWIYNKELTLERFLSKYAIDRNTYKKANITWKELKEIKSKFKSLIPDLEVTANDIVTRLFKAKRVHSIRFRIKNEEHLLEKIIRKRAENPDRIIDKTNFHEEITDLIGIRILHLYKGDWRVIHRYIDKTYDLFEEAIAYIREGDNTEIYDKEGCKSKVHKHNYRSVHYLVKTNPTKITHIAEIQVRTIFEEGWSEIDHDIRYPYNTDNDILNQYLNIFNRISGSADEMGSFIKLLNLDFINKKISHREELKAKNEKIQNLKEEIDRLTLTDDEKHSLNEKISDLPSLFSNMQTINLPTDFKIPSFSNLVIDTSKFEKLNERINAMVAALPEFQQNINEEE